MIFLFCPHDIASMINLIFNEILIMIALKLDFNIQSKYPRIKIYYFFIPIFIINYYHHQLNYNYLSLRSTPLNHRYYNIKNLFIAVAIINNLFRFSCIFHVSFQI